MKEPLLRYKKLVLVCTNLRENGEECCAQKGSVELHKKLKETVKLLDPAIRVSKTGCLGNCKSGASVVIMPDDIWLGAVTEEDIPEILKMLT